MSEYAVEVENLVKTYDHGLVRPLNGLSLKVRKGEWVAISGPSGCGKSTLLHLIAALDKPDTGRIIVDDVDLGRRKDVDAYRRNEVGLIFQLHNLLPALTAMENVEVAMFGSKMSHKEQRERAAELLTAVGLGTKKKVKPPALSGGERQRIAIARALANRPLILLADEPTGSLDSEATKVVLDLFRQVHEEFHVTLLLVTHDPEVATFADRIVHMMDGRVVSESDPRAERR